MASTKSTQDPSTGTLDAKAVAAAPRADAQQPLYMCQRLVAESDADLRTVKEAILADDFQSTPARRRIGIALGALKWDAKKIAEGLRKTESRRG